MLYRFGGEVFTPCGNRRETVCPACSDRYAADAFHVVRAGLVGGDKGIPVTVSARPRAFVTVTAPSFGPVHSQPGRSARGRRIPCRCRQHHHDADPRLGSPLDPDSYDYTGSVLWQAHAGVLWQRFTVHLRRELAKHAGIRVRDFSQHARLSYGKVAEFQRRGLVHFHAILRIDGREGPTDPPPSWADDDLLDRAVRAAAATVAVTTTRPDGTPLLLTWGDQLDIRRIHHRGAAEVEDPNGQISEQRLAAYIAKYATKGTGARDTPDRPVRSPRHIDHLHVSDHHRHMIHTAWQLGDHHNYAHLNLRRWAHMLGFRGHFLTKSRRYSTTFTAIRGERRTYRLEQTLNRIGLAEHGDTITVINDWRFVSAGYRDDAEHELATAIAQRLCQQRRQNRRNE
ncbi:replication initiator protein RepSA [Amycolatopsis minnesotensis]|uniref:Replication initiator protein RepSA n=1 Tax=Amycolatopsis minnesotensis TaxID=337894 RepID=A0ABP5E8M3_9PSEU